jgi:hypothetical protein
MVGDPSSLRSGTENGQENCHGNHGFTHATSREAKSMARELVTSSPSTLLPHRLFNDLRLLPCGLNNAVATYSTLTHPSTSMHTERPGALPRNTMELRATQAAIEDLSFLRVHRPQALSLG